MSRARELASLASPGTFTIDVANSRVGIASTMPKSTLDCGGELTSTTLEVANFAPTDLAVPGTVTAGILTAGTLTATGALTAGTLTAGTLTAGTLTSSGTITGNYFTGNGHNITGISTLNITDYGKDLGGGGGGGAVFTIGVRTGVAVTFGISGETFNITNRSGGNVPINI
tara:strand:- start:285 stop:797 length:513 start_codon:yes stop_codon:yes gene_type:complete